MLREDQEVKSLNAERFFDFKTKVSKLKGGSEDDEWLESPGSIIRALKTLVFHKKASVFVHNFDMSEIEELKM